MFIASAPGIVWSPRPTPFIHVAQASLNILTAAHIKKIRSAKMQKRFFPE